MEESSLENNLKNNDTKDDLEGDALQKDTVGEDDNELELNLGPPPEDLQPGVQGRRSEDNFDLDLKPNSLGAKDSRSEYHSLKNQSETSDALDIDDEDEKRDHLTDKQIAKVSQTENESPSHQNKENMDLGVVSKTDGSLSDEKDLSIDDTPGCSHVTRDGSLISQTEAQSTTHQNKDNMKLGVTPTAEESLCDEKDLSIGDIPGLDVMREGSISPKHGESSPKVHTEAVRLNNSNVTNKVDSATVSDEENDPIAATKPFISGHEQTEKELESVPLNEEQKVHLARVLEAVEAKNLPLLRELSRKGFVNNHARRKVWPLLLGVDVQSLEKAKQATTEGGMKLSHSYVDQVGKDVQRSMFHFDITKKFIENYRETSRKALSRIINSVLEENQQLHYTQGFHDITSVFYIVCGETLGKAMTESLCNRHIKDALRPNLEVIQMILTLIFPLISLEDEGVFNFLSRSNVQPFFALSWVLTWYSHNIENFAAVTRLYDFFIASRPLMPLYFAVAVIISLREELFKVKCDYAYVHQFFQNFSGETIDLNQSIQEAWRLSEKYPPHRLYKEFGFEPPDDSPLWVTSAGELSGKLRKIWRPKEIWDPRGVKFWTHLALPVGIAVIFFYLSSSSSSSSSRS